jgi:hypothetical protein
MPTSMGWLRTRMTLVPHSLTRSTETPVLGATGAKGTGTTTGVPVRTVLDHRILVAAFSEHHSRSVSDCLPISPNLI